MTDTLAFTLFFFVALAGLGLAHLLVRLLCWADTVENLGQKVWRGLGMAVLIAICPVLGIGLVEFVIRLGAWLIS